MPTTIILESMGATLDRTTYALVKSKEREKTQKELLRECYTRLARQLEKMRQKPLAGKKLTQMKELEELVQRLEIALLP